MIANMRKHPARHRIVVLALPDVVAFDLTIATHIFGHSDQEDFYRLRLATERPGLVQTTNGFPIGVEYDLGELRRADTVIVPGYALRGGVSPAVRAALAAASARGARVASICTGAFALAAAGLLDGRRATTHWHHAPRLAREYPAVTVDPAVLYVDEGDILTSAGVASGIDLCLHILGRDRGEDSAIAVARRMVTPLHRAGGQAQYVPVAHASGAEAVSDTARWARDRLHEPITVPDMAQHAMQSTRSFHRAFTAQTGESPHSWLVRERLQSACRLLEDPAVPVEEVAHRAGLGTSANLRLHFRRAFGTTPSAYRATFSAG